MCGPVTQGDSSEVRKTVGKPRAGGQGSAFLTLPHSAVEL